MERIAVGTKCIITKTPEGSALYTGLLGQSCTPCEKNTEGGKRGKGDQFFNLTGSGGIFANGDSGFEVKPVAA